MPMAEVTRFFSAVAADPTIRTLSQEHIRFLCSLASFSAPPTVSSMAAAAGMYPAQASRCVKSLIKQGLVHRVYPVDGADDMRTMRLELTAEGRNAYERLSKLYCRSRGGR